MKERVETRRLDSFLMLSFIARGVALYYDEINNTRIRGGDEHEYRSD